MWVRSVQEGQLLAKLEDRDAQLRLQAAMASEQQAEASLRQAESRIGLTQGGKFDCQQRARSAFSQGVL